MLKYYEFVIHKERKSLANTEQSTILERYDTYKEFHSHISFQKLNVVISPVKHFIRVSLM